MGKGSPAQPHFPRIFAFYDTSSAGSLQGGKNECRFAEVSMCEWVRNTGFRWAF